MTFREQCAIAIIKATGRVRDEIRDGRATSAFFLPPTDYILAKSNEIADAMEAERAKRAVPSVADPSLTCAEVMELGRRVGKEEMDAACEKARREGRAQGIRDARGHILGAARDAHGRGHGDYDGLVEAERVLERIAGQPPRDEVIASENAKPRAVAEAGADLLKYGVCGAGMDALISALTKWDAGWRTK